MECWDDDIVDLLLEYSGMSSMLQQTELIFEYASDRVNNGLQVGATVCVCMSVCVCA